MSMRQKTWIPIAVLSLVVAYFVTSFSMTAYSKRVWIDEVNEIESTCTQPYVQMLFGGARDQCSPGPIYYIFQKTVVQFLNPTSPYFFLEIRSISLLSSAVFLFLFGFVFYRFVGLGFALLGLAMILNQPIIHRYASESRPYFLWLTLCFLVFLGFFKFKERVARSFPVLLLILTIALSMVASPGAGQVFMVAVAAVFLNKKRFENAYFKKIGIICLFSLLVGAYYAAKGCTYWNANSSWESFLIPLRLLWPKGGIHTVLLNGLAVVGGISFIWMSQRDSKNDRFCALMSLSSVLLIILGLIVATYIIAFGYFMNERNFIYFVMCRSILITIGAYSIFRKAIELFPRYKKGISNLVVLLGIVTILPSAQYVSSVYDQDLDQTNCELIREIKTAWVPVHITREHILNFVNKIARQKKICGNSKKPKLHAILKNYEFELQYEISIDPPSESKFKVPTLFGESVQF